MRLRRWTAACVGLLLCGIPAVASASMGFPYDPLRELERGCEGDISPLDPADVEPIDWGDLEDAVVDFLRGRLGPEATLAAVASFREARQDEEGMLWSRVQIGAVILARLALDQREVAAAGVLHYSPPWGPGAWPRAMELRHLVEVGAKWESVLLGDVLAGDTLFSLHTLARLGSEQAARDLLEWRQLLGGVEYTATQLDRQLGRFLARGEACPVQDEDGSDLSDGRVVDGVQGMTRKRIVDILTARARTDRGGFAEQVLFLCREDFRPAYEGMVRTRPRLRTRAAAVLAALGSPASE